MNELQQWKTISRYPQQVSINDWNYTASNDNTNFIDLQDIYDSKFPTLLDFSQFMTDSLISKTRFQLKSYYQKLKLNCKN